MQFLKKTMKFAASIDSSFHEQFLCICNTDSILPTVERKKDRKKVKVLSPVRLCDPMDCSLPGSSVHGVFQARGLEWAAISFSTSFKIRFSPLKLSCCLINQVYVIV